MRIGFAGTPDVAVPALAALVASQHEVVVAITRPDAPAGRGKRLTPSPVAQFAGAHGIEVLKPERASDPALAERLAALQLDTVAVVAYGALLPQSLLDLVPGGWINLHFSLLPRWRGAAPVQRAIWAGDRETGACTFRIVKALDAGPVFDRVTAPITETTTAGELFDTLTESGAELLVRTMDAIAAGAEPTPQPSEGITTAAKITVEDARIDWSAAAVEVSRQIRATSPAPGAWSLLSGERFKVLAVAPAEDTDLAPGELRPERKRLLVGTGLGSLELRQVQAFGKKPMAGPDWARGASLEVGARLR